MSAFFIAHNTPWWLAMILTWVIYTAAAAVGGIIYGWVKGKI